MSTRWFHALVFSPVYNSLWFSFSGCAKLSLRAVYHGSRKFWFGLRPRLRITVTRTYTFTWLLPLTRTPRALQHLFPHSGAIWFLFTFTPHTRSVSGWFGSVRHRCVWFQVYLHGPHAFYALATLFGMVAARSLVHRVHVGSLLGSRGCRLFVTHSRSLRGSFSSSSLVTFTVHVHVRFAVLSAVVPCVACATCGLRHFTLRDTVAHAQLVAVHTTTRLSRTRLFMVRTRLRSRAGSRLVAATFTFGYASHAPKHHALVIVTHHAAALPRASGF